MVRYNYRYSYSQLKRLIDEKFNQDGNYNIFLLNGTEIVLDNFLLPMNFTFDENIKELKLVKRSLNNEVLRYIDDFGSFLKPDEVIRNFIAELKEIDEDFEPYAKYILSKKAWAIKYFDDLKDDKEFVMQVIHHDENVLFYTSKRLRGDKEVVLKAVVKNGNMLSHASNELKDDEEVVASAVKQFGNSFKYASRRLQDDKQFVLQMIDQNVEAIEHVSRRLLGDKDIFLKANKINNFAITIASQELKDDEEFMLEIIKTNGHALNYVSDRLRKNKEFLAKAVKINSRALRYVLKN